MLVDFLQADFKVLLYSKRSIGTELNMHFLLTKMHVNEHFNEMARVLKFLQIKPNQVFKKHESCVRLTSIFENAPWFTTVLANNYIHFLRFPCCEIYFLIVSFNMLLGKTGYEYC